VPYRCRTASGYRALMSNMTILFVMAQSIRSNPLPPATPRTTTLSQDAKVKALKRSERASNWRTLSEPCALHGPLRRWQVTDSTCIHPLYAADTRESACFQDRNTGTAAVQVESRQWTCCCLTGDVIRLVALAIVPVDRPQAVGQWTCRRPLRPSPSNWRTS
jgi:hypothetical protein